MSTAVSRIEKEFVLKALVEKQAPMELRFRARWISCKLVEVGDKLIKVTLDEEDLESPDKNEKVDLFFKFRGARMTFRSILRSVEDRTVTVDFPAGIYRDLSRGYERVTPPEDMKISFVIQGERVELNFPKSESFEVPEEPSAVGNFDVTRITDLLRAFREKAQTLASENKIVMFRERKPEGFEEKLIAHTGKSFIYPQSTTTNVPEKELIISPKVLTQEDVVLSETNRNRELFDVLNTIAQVNAEKEKKKILQELYSPILFHHYVVGYLYLVTFKDGGQRFSQKVIDFVYQFGRLLSYSLKVNGYFKGTPVKERVDRAELLDVSASGILFCLPLQDFESMFQLFTDMNFTLHIDNKEVLIGGRIMRRFNDQGRLYLGIMFLDIQEADRIFLLENLYGTAEVPDFYPSSEEWAL
jgi:hypothetical protein